MREVMELSILKYDIESRSSFKKPFLFTRSKYIRIQGTSRMDTTRIDNTSYTFKRAAPIVRPQLFNVNQW